jgi:hypothetical protein
MFDLLELRLMDANAPSVVSVNAAKATIDGHNTDEVFILLSRQSPCACHTTAMLKGPQSQKCPADMIGHAVHVMRIATGDIGEARGKAHRQAGKHGRQTAVFESINSN